MANFNSGLVHQFNNGGSLLVGSDTLLNYVPGSLKIENPGVKNMVHEDRGVIQDAYALGDQVARITFKLKAADLSTLATSALDKLMPAYSSGKPAYFAVTLKMPWYRGATAPNGDQVTFPNCWCERGPEISDGGPDGMDELDIVVICKDPPTPAAAFVAMT